MQAVKSDTAEAMSNIRSTGGGPVSALKTRVICDSTSVDMGTHWEATKTKIL